MIAALEFICRAEASIGIFRRTVHLIARILTITFSIADKHGVNAVTRIALEKPRNARGGICIVKNTKSVTR